MSRLLSPETVEQLVSTLRYLMAEHKNGFPIDAINMYHVERALERVDAEDAASEPNNSVSGFSLDALIQMSSH